MLYTKPIHIETIRDCADMHARQAQAAANRAAAAMGRAPTGKAHVTARRIGERLSRQAQAAADTARAYADQAQSADTLDNLKHFVEQAQASMDRAREYASRITW